MRKEFLDSQISKTQKMVRRWHGCDAAMHDLTSSHQALAIVVSGKEYGKNLLIACLGPEYICGRTRWTNSHIDIKTTTLSTGDTGILLIDLENGVRVTSESFEVKENVKL